MRSQVVTWRNERRVTDFGKEQVSPQDGAAEPGSAAAAFSAHLCKAPLFVPRLAAPDYWGSATHSTALYYMLHAVDIPSNYLNQLAGYTSI